MIESASTTFLTISSRSFAPSPSSRSAATRMRASGERRSCETPSSIARSLLVGLVALARHRAQGVAEPLDLARTADPALRQLAAGDGVDLPDEARHRRGHPAAHQRGDEDDDADEAAEREQQAPAVFGRLQAADDAGPAADAAALGDAQPRHRRIGGVVEPHLLHLDAALGQGASHRGHAAVGGELDRARGRLAAEDLDLDLHLAPHPLAGRRRRRGADRLGPERRQGRGGGAVLVGAEVAAEDPGADDEGRHHGDEDAQEHRHRAAAGPELVEPALRPRRLGLHRGGAHW